MCAFSRPLRAKLPSEVELVYREITVFSTSNKKYFSNWLKNFCLDRFVLELLGFQLRFPRFFVFQEVGFMLPVSLSVE
jgi:hypothetical protein